MTPRCELRAQNLWLTDEGILRTEMRPGIFDLELADAAAATVAAREAWGTVRHPVLVDMRGLRSMSRECRQHFAGAEAASLMAAVGLLIVSPLSRAIGNFFLGLNRPPVPTRLFTAENDALAWLREYVR